MRKREPSDNDLYHTRLAKERTRLARERTTLSHIRTGFASFLFGTAVFGLIGDPVTDVVGWFFVSVGAVFLVTGWLSYVRSNRRTHELFEEVERSLRRP